MIVFIFLLLPPPDLEEKYINEFYDNTLVFEKIEDVRAQGFSEAFNRMWEFYLCYCEGGFRERVISDVQMHLVKPMARVPMKLASLEN